MSHSNLKFTTNGCESFHRHFKEWFLSHGPDIFSFIKTKYYLNNLFEVRSRSKKTEKRDENAEFIRDLWKEVDKKNISMSTFVSLVATNLQPIGKKSAKVRRSPRVIKMIKKKFAQKTKSTIRKWILFTHYISDFYQLVRFLPFSKWNVYLLLMNLSLWDNCLFCKEVTRFEG